MEVKQNRLSIIFSSMKDHRVNRTKRHSLENIVFITVAATICGCETWNDIEDFGKDRFDWLSRHLDLPNGIPSHDTFNRFFSALDVEKFEECFRQWASSVVGSISDSVIALDGKRIVGSSKNSDNPIHVISAWSAAYGISLGQVRTDDKSNEITAIPKLLDALFIEGSIITVDAMNCQPEIAKKILSKNADYIFQVKNNRKKLYDDMDKLFRWFPADSVYAQTDDKEHGRIETRKCSVISDFTGVYKANIWVGLQSMIKIESKQVNKKTGKVVEEVRYFLSSLDPDAEKIGKAIRSHWSIENSLHWQLDVSFGEDASRKRNKNAVMNFSMINKMALSTLTKERDVKLGVRSKRLKASRSEDYLMKVMELF